MQKNQKSIQKTVKINLTLAKKLKEFASNKNQNESEAIRDAISNYVDSNNLNIENLISKQIDLIQYLIETINNNFEKTNINIENLKEEDI